jgi:hypothetical protein
LPGSVLRRAARLAAAKPAEVSALAPSTKKKPSPSFNSKKKKKAKALLRPHLRC